MVKKQAFLSIALLALILSLSLSSAYYNDYYNGYNYGNNYYNDNYYRNYYNDDFDSYSFHSVRSDPYSTRIRDYDRSDYIRYLPNGGIERTRTYISTTREYPDYGYYMPYRRYMHRYPAYLTEPRAYNYWN